MHWDRGRQHDAELVDVDLSGALFRDVDLRGARLIGVVLSGAEIDGLIDGLTVNGVEVAPLVEAELDRRDPERPLMRPVDADGVRRGWAVMQRRWSAAVAQASLLPEPLLHERVDGEWSFVETLRHLLFVADRWLWRPVLGRDALHPLGLPPAFVDDSERAGLALDVRPGFAEVAEARRQQAAEVSALLASLDDADLDRPSDRGSLLCCLRVVLDEEYAHHQFAMRDLERMAAR